MSSGCSRSIAENSFATAPSTSATLSALTLARIIVTPTAAPLSSCYEKPPERGQRDQNPAQHQICLKLLAKRLTQHVNCHAAPAPSHQAGSRTGAASVTRPRVPGGGLRNGTAWRQATTRLRRFPFISASAATPGRWRVIALTMPEPL